MARPAVMALLACALVASCQSPPTTNSTARRIVSLDYCADQFVLGLAQRRDILALSPDAGAAFSYMRAAAAGLSTVRPRAEDVLALQPDLVVRTYGGGPNVRTFFERAGVAVLQIGFADDIDGARAVIRHAARGLGAPERGETLIAGMDARLRLARVHAPGTRALYMTPAGYTAGPGTLVHGLFAAAGLDNFQSRSGWRPIPLERLAYKNPDLVAEAAFGDGTSHDDAWTSFRHPVVRRTVRSVPAAVIDGATRTQQMRRITIPGIMPTIVIILIFTIGNMMNVGFEKIILMYSPGIYEVADVIQSYVYRRGLIDFDYSFSAAVGLFNSMINLALLVGANYLARRVGETSLW